MASVRTAERLIGLSIRNSNVLRTSSRSGLTKANPATPSFQCLRAPQSSVGSSRPFSSSTARFKKGGKAARDEKKASTKVQQDEGDADPSDFTELENEIGKTIDRLKDALSRLRVGGRFNPEIVENLRVEAEKGSKQTVKLSDLAQCIPKGRQLHIMVGDKEHIKPISSSIQTSSLSLTPQPDPTGANALLLVLNIPPPTAESRKAVVEEASKAGDKAQTTIRDARGKQQKKLRAMQLAKSARPDDLKKAGAAMEKVVEKGSSEVKKVVDQAKKMLESG
ncbi:ribosome recycling factor [Polychaeton citri CBS 116435]|uniref:Ribosome recycling factor n=1 Tax=Polychaeton citri CBS 116435 TaxID=1314669 RepID=A0A9P4Q5K9_9PEZI|nr:ribosome recycling factor [Polychaeton citri CBS 116435]